MAGERKLFLTQWGYQKRPYEGLNRVFFKSLFFIVIFSEKLDPHKAGTITLAEANAFQTDAGEDEVERFPREFVIAGDGVLLR